MIRGAIFDVDGTILDSMPIWDDVASRYLRKRGKEPQQGLGKLLAPMTVEEGCSYVKQYYDLPEEINEIKQGVVAIIKQFYYEEAPLKAGMLELLEELSKRNIPMAVATTGERDLVEHAFKRLGILRYFKGIFTGSEVGKGKSDPLIYEKAAELLGMPKEGIYVFEDALYAIKTAKKAGFPVAGIYDASGEKDQLEIKNLVDVYVPGEICIGGTTLYRFIKLMHM